MEKQRDKDRKEEFRIACKKQMEDNQKFKESGGNFNNSIIGKSAINEDNVFKELFEPKRNLSFEKAAKNDGHVKRFQA
jgi:hypothetical protein